MAEIKGIAVNREALNIYDGTVVDLAGSMATTELTPALSGALAITNPALESLAGTLAIARDFIDMIFDRNTRPQVRVWIDGVEVSNLIEGSLSVIFNDESAGVFSFGLGGPAYNPLSNTDIRSGKEIIIKSVYSDATGTAFETPLFKGVIRDISYQGGSADVRISGVDMSALVSRESDRLDMEIYSVDAVLETNMADSTTQVTVSKLISTEIDQAITGVWLESDIARATNYYIGGGFSGKVISLGSPLPSVQNVVVGYFEGDLTVASTPRLKKSDIIRRIAGIAGIDSVVFPPRKDEDILSYKYVYANKEFPLDIIKKIGVPQAWRVKFNELGELEIWRSKIKSAPNWTLDDSQIDAGSIRVRFDDSQVINQQSVLGGIKEQQVLTLAGSAGTAPVFHPYSETLGEREVITSATLTLGGQGSVITNNSPFGPRLSRNEPAINEEISISIPSNFTSIGITSHKTTGLYANSNQLPSISIFLTSYWVKGNVGISQGKIKIQRLYQVAYTNTSTWYNLPPLDVSFTITGRQIISTPGWTDPGVDPVPPEYSTSYYQVGTEISDGKSAAKYGKRVGKIYRGQFIETQKQCRRVAEEIIKEANKVWTITLTVPLNPLIKRGQTLRVNSGLDGVDHTDIITNVGHSLDPSTGAATTMITMRAAEYVFQSELGENL